MKLLSSIGCTRIRAVEVILGRVRHARHLAGSAGCAGRCAASRVHALNVSDIGKNPGSFAALGLEQQPRNGTGSHRRIRGCAGQFHSDDFAAAVAFPGRAREVDADDIAIGIGQHGLGNTGPQLPVVPL